MYAFLAAVILLGLWNTVAAQPSSGDYDYREGVSVWFRGHLPRSTRTPS